MMSKNFLLSAVCLTVIGLGCTAQEPPATSPGAKTGSPVPKAATRSLLLTELDAHLAKVVKLQKESPDNVAAMIVRAEHHYYRGEYAEAIALNETAQEKVGLGFGSLTLKLDHVRYLAGSGKLTQAQILLKQVVSENPKLAFAGMRMGELEDIRDAREIDAAIFLLQVNGPSKTIREIFSTFQAKPVAERLRLLLIDPTLDVGFRTMIANEMIPLGKPAVDVIQKMDDELGVFLTELDSERKQLYKRLLYEDRTAGTEYNQMVQLIEGFKKVQSNTQKVREAVTKGVEAGKK